MSITLLKLSYLEICFKARIPGGGKHINVTFKLIHQKPGYEDSKFILFGTCTDGTHETSRKFSRSDIHYGREIWTQPSLLRSVSRGLELSGLPFLKQMDC